MPIHAPMHIGSFANCAALSQHRDDTRLTDSLPGQAQHEGVKLRAGQGQCACTILGPDVNADLILTQWVRITPALTRAGLINSLKWRIRLVG